jgi:hypothetical protein
MEVSANHTAEVVGCSFLTNVAHKVIVDASSESCGFFSEEPLDTRKKTHEARDLTYNELGVEPFNQCLGSLNMGFDLHLIWTDKELSASVRMSPRKGWYLANNKPWSE